jgi:glycosyltransferase involved in cell wall biosynthesis
MMQDATQRPTVLLVSPLPPRAGGIGIQSAMLLRGLRADGWTVRTVRSNTGERAVTHWPRVLRRVALSLVWLGFLVRVVVALLHSRVVILVTSSWLTFHLKARPVLRLASWLGRPVILLYKGGDAGNFIVAEGHVVLPCIRRAARLVVPSEFLRDMFASHGLAATVVPNLIDAERFVYRPRPVAPLRGLVTRSLESIYNNAMAIRAWAILRRRHPDAELWIAGEGPEEAALRRLAEELCPGAVRFLGQQRHEDMGRLYDQCTVLVNPTNIDNMPGSVLEGQTAGLPVVSTNVGGVPLLVQHETTGLLVPPDDPEAMAAAVERLMTEGGLVERGVRHAREAVRKYEWQTVGIAWQQLIAAAAAEKRE